MVLAAFHIRHDTTSVEPVTEEYIKDGAPTSCASRSHPMSPSWHHGPFLLGRHEQTRRGDAELNQFGPVIILRLRNMTALDGTGLHALEAFAKRVHSGGRTLVMCGARRQPFKLIRHSKLIHLLGRENVVPHVEAALQRAQAQYEGFGGIAAETVKDLNKHPL